MPLATGTRLGPYEIVAVIGAGGMGEVYRARDTKLGRDVAIKLLLGSLVADADRISRFQREAQVLASLNHPAIAHLYGFEDGTTPFLVMELVPGDTLADRIARGALPPSEALPIARQIAEALEAAHDLGIVHRDLKPANVKVRDDGTVKVLDFGLAKALVADTSGAAAAMNSPTLTARATQLGMILGTAAYMAPEQAKGKSVDRRADIWAFGVVLYEMLTGRTTFSGETITDIIAAVVTRDPDWAALPPATPLALTQLLRRCLERDPKQRLQSIGEARIAIEKLIANPGGGEAAGVVAAPAVRARYAWLWIAGAVVGTAIVTALAAWAVRPAPEPPVTRRFVLPGTPLSGGAPGDNARAFSISADGRKIVFVADRETPDLGTRRAAAARPRRSRDDGHRRDRREPGVVAGRRRRGVHRLGTLVAHSGTRRHADADLFAERRAGRRRVGTRRSVRLWTDARAHVRGVSQGRRAARADSARP